VSAKLAVIAATPSAPELSEKVEGIEDADLVARALQGDLKAEDALFRRHGRAVAGLVARLLGSAQDADDVVHDAFLRSFRELDRLREPTRFRPWVTQIAVNRVRWVLRRRSLERRLGLFQGECDAALELLASRELPPEARAELALIDGVLRRLPAAQRIVWMLRMVEGHGIDEAAALSGCSVATAKRWFARANRLVQARVRVRGDVERGGHGDE
jgi:RNA polymerase sigma-70 factor (ECF subfamily)